MVTLTWAIALLLNNRHTLKRAQAELDAHIGRDRFVSESDMGKLVYIQAIVKETLRLYPAAPLSAPHEFNKDCTIGGYYISKDTRLMTNLRKIQTDPKMWPDDPLGFKPDDPKMYLVLVRFRLDHVIPDFPGYPCNASI